MVSMPHWPAYTSSSLDICFSRQRMLFVLEKLKNPQNNLKNVIQITGTNGKGSVSKYVSKILTEHGFKVGTYTSPHIHDCNERILINGKEISDIDVFFYMEKVRDVCEKFNLQLSFFEAFTVLCILYFNDFKPDYCVFEVGAGGLNDATNVFHENQLACIFTPIDLDHAVILGNTIEEVAAHKAYLINDVCKNIVISKQSHQRCVEIIDKRCNNVVFENKIIFGEDFYFTEQGDCFDVFYGEKSFKFERPSLKGDYQILNATTAICLIFLILKNFDIEKINRGLQVDHFCRLEEFDLSGFNKNLRLIVDGAHNPHGSKYLCEYLKKDFNDTDIYIVVARSYHDGNENNIEFLKPFSEINVKQIICSKALEAEMESCYKLKNACDVLKLDSVIELDVCEFLEKMLKKNFKRKTLIIACGSLYIRRNLKIFLDDVRKNYI